MKPFLFIIAMTIGSCTLAKGDQSLFESCLSLKQDTESSESESCRSYIKGFMGATYLSGVAIDAKPHKNNSDFFKRAYETRVGTASTDRRQQECNISKNQDFIISEISARIPQQLDQFSQLNSLIISVIRENQSCSNETS